MDEVYLEVKRGMGMNIYDINCSRGVPMSRYAEQLQSLEIGGSAAPKTSNSIILPALRVFLGNKKPCLTSAHVRRSSRAAFGMPPHKCSA